jgi:hypothetical protein
VDEKDCNYSCVYFLFTSASQLTIVIISEEEHLFTTSFFGVVHKASLHSGGNPPMTPS